MATRKQKQAEPPVLTEVAQLGSLTAEALGITQAELEAISVDAHGQPAPEAQVRGRASKLNKRR